MSEQQNLLAEQNFSPEVNMSSEQAMTGNQIISGTVSGEREQSPAPTEEPKPLPPPKDVNVPVIEQPTTTDPTSFKLWNPPESSKEPRTKDDLPDEYFDPTLDELKKAYQSQKRLRETLVDAPLKTQSVRQAEEATKLKRWPNTTIRVKFPDRTQLEKTFPSTDKIKSIYAFVRNSLREDVKPIKFILYQAPPRVEFKVSDAAVRDKSLAQLSLSPSSILHLQFLDDKLNDPRLKAPLSEEMWKHARDLPKPKVFDEPKKGQSKSSGGSKQQMGNTLEKMQLPKWLSQLTKK